MFLISNKLLTRLLAAAISVSLYSCGNDGPDDKSKVDNPVPDENFIPKWEHISGNSNIPDNNIFIGYNYRGICGYTDTKVPDLYVGAAFYKDDFATSFDNAISAPKHPAVLSASFGSQSFDKENVTLSGADYRSFVKSMLKSTEFEQFADHNNAYLIDFSICDAKTVGNLSKVFAENNDFAKGLTTVVGEVPNIGKSKSIVVGNMIIGGFSIGMPTPASGLFISPVGDEAVYIRSLTYGATVSFVVISDLGYEDVLSCFKGVDSSISDSFLKMDGKLHNSTIVSFICNDITQNARVATTFEELQTFLAQPFTDVAYGYPIFCTGYYSNDNSIFRLQ